MVVAELRIIVTPVLPWLSYLWLFDLRAPCLPSNSMLSVVDANIGSIAMSMIRNLASKSVLWHDFHLCFTSMRAQEIT